MLTFKSDLSLGEKVWLDINTGVRLCQCVVKYIVKFVNTWDDGSQPRNSMHGISTVLCTVDSLPDNWLPGLLDARIFI